MIIRPLMYICIVATAIPIFAADKPSPFGSSSSLISLATGTAEHHNPISPQRHASTPLLQHDAPDSAVLPPATTAAAGGGSLASLTVSADISTLAALPTSALAVTSPVLTAPVSTPPTANGSFAQAIEDAMNGINSIQVPLEQTAANDSATSRVTLLTAATAATSTALLYWAFNPAQVGDTVTRRLKTSTRFVPLALAAPALLSGAQSALSSVATPLACLAVTGVVYYKFKDSILEPEKRKRKELMENVKKELAEHKVQMAKLLAENNTAHKKFTDGIHNEVLQLRTNITTTQAQLDKDFAALKSKVDTRLTLADEKINAALPNIDAVQKDIAAVQTGLTAVSTSNHELHGKIDGLKDKVLTTLASSHTLTSKIFDDVAKQAAALASQQEALKKFQNSLVAHQNSANEQFAAVKKALDDKKDKRK